MDKTLHTKLTEKHFYADAAAVLCADGDDMLAGLKHEMKILYFASKELLQPRPEAIQGILEKARAL